MDCSLTPRAEKIVRNALSAVRDGGMMVSTHRFDQPGFNHLDSGSHRHVFTETEAAKRGEEPGVFTGDTECVLKVQKNDDPWSTRNEIINYEFAPPELKQHLAPIHQWAEDGMWVVMEKADQEDYSGPIESEPSVTLLESSNLEDNLFDSGFKLRDIRPDNLGYIDGNLVVIDYGFRITTPDGRLGPEGSEYFGQSPHEKRMEEHFG